MQRLQHSFADVASCSEASVSVAAKRERLLMGICVQFALHQVNSRLQSRVRVTTECMELNMPHLCHVVTHEVCRWPRLRLFVSCRLRQSRTRLNTQAVRQGAPHQALA
jgi:hypothetical protein